jgi:hypothetical protein
VQRVPVKNKDIIWRNVAGETVLLNPQNGKYYGLNAVGCSFWEKVDGNISVAKIIDILLKEYDVERSILVGDIMELVAGLNENGLLSME